MGIRAEDRAQVWTALEQGLPSSGPSLIDVLTDRSVLSLPPRDTFQTAKGFVLALTKAAFTGNRGDVLDAAVFDW